MFANVDNFQETPENGSILVLEGRLATPSSFLSPEFLLGTRTNLNRVAMSHDTQWVTLHSETLGQGPPPPPGWEQDQGIKGKGSIDSPTILTVSWRDGTSGLLHLHLERQC